MDVNNNLNANKVFYQGYYEINELSISSTTSLNDLVEGNLLPSGSVITLWVNDKTTFGTEIRNGIKTAYPNINFYGYITMQRTIDGATIYMYARSYENCDMYINRYTTVNSLGWQSQWRKVNPVWSDWVSLGINGIGIEAKYRYNDSMVEIAYSGSFNGKTITVNSPGYIWEAVPPFTPKINMHIPVAYMENGLIIRFYPTASDGASGKFTLTAMQQTIKSQGYISGSFVYGI